jgi:HEAT repeat protein
MCIFIWLVYPCCLFVCSPLLISADKEEAAPAEPKRTPEEVFESVRDAFESEKELSVYLRVATVKKFGAAPCDKTVEFLAAVFDEEPNAAMRAAVFHALGQIGNRSAVETVVGVLLPRCMEESLRGGEEEKGKALAAFVFLMDELEIALRQPLSADAEAWLVKKGLTSAIRNNERAKKAVLTAIVRLKTEDRGKLILGELAATPAPEVQAMLLESLMPFANKQAVSAAGRFLRSSDPAVRVAAYELLGTYRPKKKTKKFVSGMRDAHWEVRVVCLEVLAKISEKELLKQAKKALGDSNWHVQVAAVHFLVQRGGPKVIKPLYKALDTTEGRVLGDISDGLARLTGRNFGPISAQWDSWWLQNKKKHLPLKPMSADDFAALKEEDRNQSTVSGALYFGLRVFSKNLAFVVDCSESMEEQHTPPKKSAATVVDGQKKKGGKKGPSRLTIAKRELAGAIRGLEDGKKVNLLTFNTDVTDFVAVSAPSREKTLTELGPKTRKPLNAFIDATRPVGATNVSAALRDAFEYSELDTIFLLSDGAPTVGITDQQELLETVERWNRRRRVKINSISFSATPAEKRLLRSLSDRNFGVYVER